MSDAIMDAIEQLTSKIVQQRRLLDKCYTLAHDEGIRANQAEHQLERCKQEIERLRVALDDIEASPEHPLRVQGVAREALK